MTSIAPPGSPERGLLLACARLEMAPASADRIRRAIGTGIDWDRTIDLAARNGLVAFLHRHLVADPVAPIPDDAVARIRALYRDDAHRSLRLSAELMRVVARLSGAGIDALPYKGPTLAVQAYGDLSMRPYIDLDVLVRPADAPRAIGVLGEMGYASVYALTPAQDAFFRRTDGDYPLVHRQTGTLLELHCRPSSLRFVAPIDTDALMRRAAAVSLGGSTVLAPAVDDLLVILCSHGAKHVWRRLEWVAAVAELLRRGEADPRAVLDRATALHARRAVLLGFHLAHRLLDAPLPDEVARSIDGDPAVADLAREAETRMFTHVDDGADDTAARLAYNLRARDGLADRARYAWRWLTLPTPEDWAWRRVPDPLFSLYRVIRPLRLALKHARPR